MREQQKQKAAAAAAAAAAGAAGAAAAGPEEEALPEVEELALALTDLAAMQEWADEVGPRASGGPGVHEPRRYYRWGRNAQLVAW
jgi:hypothetical protein